MRTSSLLLYGAGQLGINLLARYFFQWVIRFADVGKDTAAGPLLAASMVGGLLVMGVISAGLGLAALVPA